MNRYCKFPDGLEDIPHWFWVLIDGLVINTNLHRLFCSFLTVFWSFWQILLSKTCIKPHWGKLQLLLKKGAKNGAFLSPLRSTLYGSTFSWFEFQKILRFCKIFSFLWITRKIYVFWTLKRSLLPGKIQFPTTLYFISKICLLHKILRKSPVLKPENAIF